ncbi:hypothetical protein LSTR_LSTR006825 [Laodelphax striatellus]|uniref:Beta-lactamase-like protein 2 homolog n=1 Tax=Laodelphax striatellus TaxID=195883 RepID=A0A482XE52_LAOST|nr:hypothetical protein LSTR_LSTR006825 [Laodelphax striatellus]
MATVLPAISKLTSRVIRVLGCNPGPMTLQGTNSYIVGTGKRRILIDTSEPQIAEYTDTLKGVLKNENVQLEHIIVTHWHNDHIGAVANVLDKISPECKVWKYPRDNTEEKFEFSPLENGQVFQVEGATLSVIHTPGHTTDHVVLSLKEENALFSGDCILGEGTTVFEDLYEYMKSLETIRNLQPSCIYPGHGPLVEEPSSVIEYYIKHRNDRENEIINFLKSENRTVTEMDVVKVLYKGYPERLQKPALYAVRKHFEKLEKDGQVIEHNDGWSLKEKSKV